MNDANAPANSAQLKIARNGGTRRIEKMTSRMSGSMLMRPIENSPASVAWALAESNPGPVAGVARPRIANRTSAMTTAGPDVQIIAPMCWLVVTPPTMDGTRTVVSETGVILSPK